MKYTVETEQPIRLDIWLSQKLGQSRSQIQKLIKSGAVLVNGNVKTPHFEIRQGDSVQFLSSSSTPVEDPETKNKKQKDLNSFGVSVGFLDSRFRGNDGERSGSDKGKEFRNDNVGMKIIFESPDYLIVEKPEGVVVHHDAKHKSGTLVDWVLERYPEIAHVGDPERPGVVHRLDKEVSGLLVIARTQMFYEYIRTQFDEREMTKEYLALVLGKVVNLTGTVDFKIVRSKIREKYIGLPPTSDDLDAKSAVTHYEVIRANHHYSLLKLFPETGRTHQLRVHMRTFGHPIAGDRLYSLPKFRHLNEKFSRVFLHARSLSFKSLQDEQVSYSSSVPKVMKDMIEDIFHLKDF